MSKYVWIVRDYQGEIERVYSQLKNAVRDYMPRVPDGKLRKSYGSHYCIEELITHNEYGEPELKPFWEIHYEIDKWRINKK